MELDEVQHPLDRSVDFVLKPVWRLTEPILCMTSYIFNSVPRVHLRLEAKLSEANRAVFVGRHGSWAELGVGLRSAAARTCSDLRRVFNQVEAKCPDVLLVRGADARVVSMPLGFGRKWLLVATEGLVEQANERQLRFIIGREIGLTWLRHGDLLAPWPWQRLARDALVFPRYLAGRLFPPPPARTGGSLPLRRGSWWWGLGGRDIKGGVDSFVGACDLMRGLMLGRWPGCTDLDLDGMLGVAGGRSRGGWGGRHGDSNELVESALEVCSQLRRPDVGGGDCRILASASY